ncbi:YesL family protein [Oceanobacillus chungangensis]|uniref:DUF624 domain-containing protein n=1 Tax=Oceanobacillus chungangensis TaxID=1229152 RepID=A0A3D8PY18_9BACI|nr:DUF624 domain-containing protein [Oceanobacillus chungangensis]RDW20672.1 hypothetical protein CWR45_05440 [Oceanobacillus chungangensis]
MNSITSGIFAGFDWFMRIVKLNILWLLSCFVGLFVVGLFPATAAAVAVTNEWVKGNADVSIWNTYKEAFKKYFLKSQVIGYSFAMVYLILIVDIRLFLSFDNHLIWDVMIIAFSILLFLVLVVNLYMLPMMIEQGLGLKELIQKAFFTGAAYIHLTIINLIGVLAIGLITFRYPAALIFLSGGGGILWLTCMNQIVRNKIEIKYTKLHNASKGFNKV